MTDVLDELRTACADIAVCARHVRVDEGAVPAYAERLPAEAPRPDADPDPRVLRGDREQLAAFWLTLDAINFGSGWFPTLRKQPGRSGYHTIAARLRQRFESQGSWSADQLQAIDASSIAAVLGQDPGHELMELFARALRDLGARVGSEPGGSFVHLVDAAQGSAVRLVERLAGWSCFADVSSYGGLRVPFLKRAQIAGADLHRAGVSHFGDLERLTMFADNLVPHVLRVDGLLRYTRALQGRIERGELIAHGSAEEIEIRGCAVHAVELLARVQPGSCPAQIDQHLWLRGQDARYKALPRHRTRCTAY